MRLVISTDRLQFVGYCEKYDQIKQHVVASWYFGLVLSSDEIVDCQEGELEVIDNEVSLSNLKNIGPVTLEMIKRFAGQHHKSQQPSTSSQIESFTLDRNHKLEVLSALLNYAIYEAQTYWHRTTLFLTINSIILALVLAKNKAIPATIIMAIGIFGVILNTAWYRLADYGKFLAEKWREDAREVVRTDTAFSAVFRSLLKNPRIKKPKGAKPSKIIKDVVLVFLLLWALIFVYGTLTYFECPIIIP